MSPRGHPVSQTQTKTDNPPSRGHMQQELELCLLPLQIPSYAEASGMSTEQVKRCCEIAGCVLVFWPRDSQSGIARPPCRQGNNRSACDLIGIPTYSPPGFVCRGSRGRQGLNVGPTPSHRHRPRRRRHVMFWSQGRELLCFPFLSIIKQLRFFPPGGDAFTPRHSNPPNCVLLIRRYIATPCTQEEQQAVEEAQVHLNKMGRVGSFLLRTVVLL